MCRLKYVVVVNGKPESGKTTFEEACAEYLNISEMAWCHIVSSIDPIKKIYKSLGWDGKKTDKARKDLSILKKMWIDNCDGPISYIVKFITELSNDEDHVVFVDIREESEIIKLVEVLDTLHVIDIRHSTIFIMRPENAGIEYGNKSDDMIGSNLSIYDTIISNSGDIDKLREQAKEFINTLMEE